MLRTLRLFVPAVSIALLGAACGGDDPSAGGSGDGETVDVSLADHGVTLSRSEVPAGSITFTATNEGSETHEIEVFEGDADPASLPIEDDVANTDPWTLVDEIEDITPGASADLTIDLEPGTYQVVCNLAGHFQNGMYATLTVA